MYTTKHIINYYIYDRLNGKTYKFTNKHDLFKWIYHMFDHPFYGRTKRLEYFLGEQNYTGNDTTVVTKKDYIVDDDGVVYGYIKERQVFTKRYTTYKEENGHITIINPREIFEIYDKEGFVKTGKEENKFRYRKRRHSAYQWRHKRWMPVDKYDLYDEDEKQYFNGKNPRKTGHIITDIKYYGKKSKSWKDQSKNKRQYGNYQKKNNYFETYDTEEELAIWYDETA